MSYAIAHRIRIEILCLLNEAIYSATELAELTHWPLTTIGHHICDSAHNRPAGSSGWNANICSYGKKGRPMAGERSASMADNSAIEWTEATWNPVTGCFQVSPGCAHCYAKTFAERWRGVPGHPYEQGFELRLWPQRLEQPLRWARPRMIFVNSMSDLFHEDIPEEYIEEVFEVMGRADHHTFQILTKRHERLAELAPSLPWHPNVWIGVSIENRRFTHRADYLREVDAEVRFISAEPLLGSLDDLDLSGIHWLIAGGESGPKHRPMRIEWARELRDRCLDEEVAFFFKQWGGHRPKSGGRLLDGHTWDEMPTRQIALAAA